MELEWRNASRVELVEAGTRDESINVYRHVVLSRGVTERSQVKHRSRWNHFAVVRLTENCVEHIKRILTQFEPVARQPPVNLSARTRDFGCVQSTENYNWVHRNPCECDRCQLTRTWHSTNRLRSSGETLSSWVVLHSCQNDLNNRRRMTSWSTVSTEVETRWGASKEPLSMAPTMSDKSFHYEVTASWAEWNTGSSLLLSGQPINCYLKMRPRTVDNLRSV